MEKILIIGFRVPNQSNKPVYFGIDQQTGKEEFNGYSSIEDIREAASKSGYKLLMDINS